MAYCYPHSYDRLPYGSSELPPNSYDYTTGSAAMAADLSQYQGSPSLYFPEDDTTRTTSMSFDMSQDYGASPSYNTGDTTVMASHASQPLSRHSSSEGSSQSSSTPTSPMGGSCHNFDGYQYAQMSPEAPMAYDHEQDQSGWYDLSMPRTVHDEQSGAATHSRDRPVCCLHPDCNSKPFKRRADLDRHYRHRHAPDSQKEAYYCDYRRCPRRHDPFHRRDHFRDHLREFHKEDIEKRGGSINEEFFDGRNLNASWWRCPRCLKRIVISRYGYECPSCKTSCQPQRKEARRKETSKPASGDARAVSRGSASVVTASDARAARPRASHRASKD